ncbi:hypothetical protein [Paraburkholderia tropica]|uniref:hypothetical protein n=1 Tax=Paraburkholderia tropica TaxID=92647 RepID=UPI00160A0BA4|nr:hypothetical protein [Paraburkholderia tropica]MBB6319249.1 hypothetical protein [Paraburkholderia tropica]
MQLDDDLDAYLTDFGDGVSAPDLEAEGMAIVSQPDRAVLDGMATAPAFTMTARTDVFGGAEYEMLINVTSGLCAGSYTVSGPVMQLSDGAFCIVPLSKVNR